MLTIDIPGYKKLNIENVVFDFNGTLGNNGHLDSGIDKLIESLSQQVNIYVVTSDTYGTVENECKDIHVKIHILKGNDSVKEKADFVNELGKDGTVCIGNGYNDSGMFEISALAIAIIGEEGAALKALLNADIIVKNSRDALMLLNYPTRIIATLRR